MAKLFSLHFFQGFFGLQALKDDGRGTIVVLTQFRQFPFGGVTIRSYAFESKGLRCFLRLGGNTEFRRRSLVSWQADGWTRALYYSYLTKAEYSSKVGTKS